MTDAPEELLRSIDENLREVRNWLRLEHMDQVKEVFEESKDWEIYLYEQLDGETSTRDLQKAVPVSRVTVMNRLKRWKKLGLVDQEKQGRYQKIISLKTIDVDIPELEDDKNVEE
jgi:uncharacterized membrane protein